MGRQRMNYAARTVMWRGESYTYAQAAEMVDISVEAFARRMQKGWSVHDAMTIKRGSQRAERSGKNGQRPQTVFDGLTPVEALAMRWVGA